LTNGVLQERSLNPAISGTGRFTIFDSAAAHLAPGVLSNGKRQVYLHDRETGITELISVGPGNVPGDDDSFVAAVSDDGQLVAFDSFAANLIAADTNGARDVFLRNRTTGVTERISQGVQGVQGICPNPGEGCNSFTPALSADGKVIAFGSFSRLAPDDTDDGTDIYVLDRRGAPVLRRISAGIGGAQANILNGSPSVSADGQFVAFASNASNILAGDSADIVTDIFLFSLQTGVLRKVSIPAGGGAAEGDSFGPSLSGDGRFVAFWSQAGNLIAGPPDGDNIADVFVADTLGAQPSIVKVSVNLNLAGGNGDSRFSSISRDGRLVAYDSLATNFDVTAADTNGVRDIVVTDRSCMFDATQPCLVKRVSLHGKGGESNGESRYPAISGDGRFVVYYSDGSSLVDGDTNGVRDAFVSRRP
jgi:Tol biopolymer transport system component